MNSDWLPPLVYLQEHGGNWDKYLRAIYEVFRTDFVLSHPDFRGLPVRIRHMPRDDNKEATFWHLISEGKGEEERIPDLRRCERIRWPRPVVENHFVSGIRVWESRRGVKTNICIWFLEVDYLVVLGKRNGYVLLVTAYPVIYDNKRRDLEREYAAFMANAAC